MGHRWKNFNIIWLLRNNFLWCFVTSDTAHRELPPPCHPPHTPRIRPTYITISTRALSDVIFFFSYIGFFFRVVLVRRASYFFLYWFIDSPILIDGVFFSFLDSFFVNVVLILYWLSLILCWYCVSIIFFCLVLLCGLFDSFIMF
jgi:hypothetical protein